MNVFSQQSSVARKEPLVFHASGLEFFSIWWVNTILTVLTLGLYAPWAKVRANRYLYGNLELAGSRFEYHATGKQIFNGFLVVYALAIVFSLMSLFAKNALGLLFIAYILVLPVLVVMSLRFRAAVTSYRAIRFRFEHSISQAYVKALLLVLAAVGSFGLALPWVSWRIKKWKVDNLKFGDASFACSGRFNRLFKTLVVLALIFFGVVAVAAILIFGAMPEAFQVPVSPVQPGQDAPAGAAAHVIGSGLISVFIGFMVGYAFLMLIAVPVYQVVAINNLWGNTTLGKSSIHSNMKVGAALKVILLNAVLTFITLGLYFPVAYLNWMRLRYESMSVEFDESFNEIVEGEKQRQSAFADSATDAMDFGIGL